MEISLVTAGEHTNCLAAEVGLEPSTLEVRVLPSHCATRRVQVTGNILQLGECGHHQYIGELGVIPLLK